MDKSVRKCDIKEADCGPQCDACILLTITNAQDEPKYCPFTGERVIWLDGI